MPRTNPKCPHCEEPVLRGEWDTNLSPEPWHSECLFRTIMGSLAHLQGRCSCEVPGSTECDPPGMTKRQAATAAFRWYYPHGAGRKVRVACPDPPTTPTTSTPGGETIQ